MRVNMSDCNVCHEDSSLMFVGVSNYTDKHLRFELKGVEEAPVGFCPDRDPSAVQTPDGFSTKLLPRDINLNPVKDFFYTKANTDQMPIYSVEVGGVKLEGLTEQELIKELFNRDILLVIKTPYKVPCTDVENISNSLSIISDLDYNYNRIWSLFVNEEYVGTTDSGYSYVESMNGIFPELDISYTSGLVFKNKSENPMFIQLYTDTVEGLPEEFPHTENSSFIYEHDSISFCLGVL